MRILNKHIKNLIESLENKGIIFYFDNDVTKIKTNNSLINNIDDYVVRRLENVVFEKNGIKYKIYEPIFFRESGICSYLKKINDGFEYIDMDDKTYYDLQLFFILNYFKKYEISNRKSL